MSGRFKIKQSQAGFTLIETILAMVVFAVGVTGAVAISQNVVIKSANSDFRLVAGQLASEKIEMIIADKKFRGYSYIKQSNYRLEELNDAEFWRYQRATSILEVSASDYTTASPGSGVKLVKVTVFWTYQRDLDSVVLTTLVTDYS